MPRTGPSPGEVDETTVFTQRRASCPLPVEDWNLLFDAVAYRLRQGVGGSTPAWPAVQATVLDCVQALEGLQAALAQERGRGLRMETQWREAFMALRAAQAQVAELQARCRVHPASHGAAMCDSARTAEAGSAMLKS